MKQGIPGQTLASDDSDSNDYAGGSTVMEKALVRRQDMRLIPLCCFVYLLCFLDRSNIGTFRISSKTSHNFTPIPCNMKSRHDAKTHSQGNAQILNSESGDDLLQQTKMTPHQFRYDGEASSEFDA